VNPKFTPRTTEDILRLIAEHPLGWVISRDFQATPLPLLAETDAAGALVSLFGHFACRNPQVAALSADPAALILFQGPQAYIAPRLVSNPTWGPTWNYAVVRCEVTMEFVRAETPEAVRRLAAHLERAHPAPWRVEQMAHRYAELLPHIIAFRAHVRRLHPTFKLGQDENDATFGEIVSGLEGTPLAALMSEQRAPGSR
jgi:transcriptional regulator